MNFDWATGATIVGVTWGIILPVDLMLVRNIVQMFQESHNRTLRESKTGQDQLMAHRITTVEQSQRKMEIEWRDELKQVHARLDQIFKILSKKNEQDN